MIAVMIKVTSKGPIFFTQERIGHHGKIFKIFKFRTMHHSNDNEQNHKNLIKKILTDNNSTSNHNEHYLAHVNQRITWIGKFLRTSSLDELPQLFNILIGHMSLIGPRPHPVYEVQEYKEWYKRRLHVKPGLTGWSKLNLRLSPENYEESILYDLWYVDNWSIITDLKIIFMTIPFIIFNKAS
jgi:lipopolysaccharide/colanic/teichoic acid biosynthesis glycosyltransferase